MLSEQELNNIRHDMAMKRYSDAWDGGSVAQADIRKLLDHIHDQESALAQKDAELAHVRREREELLVAVLCDKDDPVCPPHDDRKECIEIGDCASCWDKHLASLTATKDPNPLNQIPRTQEKQQHDHP